MRWGRESRQEGERTRWMSRISNTATSAIDSCKNKKERSVLLLLRLLRLLLLLRVLLLPLLLLLRGFLLLLRALLHFLVLLRVLLFFFFFFSSTSYISSISSSSSSNSPSRFVVPSISLDFFLIHVSSSFFCFSSTLRFFWLRVCFFLINRPYCRQNNRCRRR